MLSNIFDVFEVLLASQSISKIQLLFIILYLKIITKPCKENIHSLHYMYCKTYMYIYYIYYIKMKYIKFSKGKSDLNPCPLPHIQNL